MIFFALDTHLNKIEPASRLDRFKTENFYRIYGLKQENNPPVLISYFKTLPNGKTEKEVKQLLRPYGIPVVFEELKWDNLTIGLRKDLREHIFLAGAVVNLIVGFLENKIGPKRFKLGMSRIPEHFLEKKIDFTNFED